MDWIGGGDNGFESPSGRLLRDAIMASLGIMAAIVVFLLPHINEPKENQAEARARGNVRIEIYWPNEINADIDLWSKAPGDNPVGYSNKNGRIFNLVRDDLGTYNDISGKNYEVTFSRGIPDGDWTINIHLYRNESGNPPVPVTVILTIQENDTVNAKGSPAKILHKTEQLTTVGQEVTLVRFSTLNRKLVDGSINFVPNMIRVAPTDTTP
jgi:hypothetical protein